MHIKHAILYTCRQANTTIIKHWMRIVTANAISTQHPGMASARDVAA